MFALIERVHEHAPRADIETEGAEAHQGVGAGIAQRAHHLGEQMRGVALNHTAAGVDHRALGGQQLVHRFLDLTGMTTARRRVGAQLDLGRVVVIELLVRVGAILGDVDDDRAGTAGRGDVERLFHHARNFRGMTNLEAVLHDRAADADHVGFLEGIFADEVRGHLTGDDDHGDVVHVGRGNRRHRVGGTRAGGDEHAADLAGGTRVAVSGMAGGLLVTDQDVLDLVLLKDGVVNMQHGATGITKQEFNAFIRERANEHFTAR